MEKMKVSELPEGRAPEQSRYTRVHGGSGGRRTVWRMLGQAVKGVAQGRTIGGNDFVMRSAGLRSGEATVKAWGVGLM